MTERQPHDGPWRVYHDLACSTPLPGIHTSCEEAKAAAGGLGCRYVSNGQLIYYRGADSFWYRY